MGDGRLRGAAEPRKETAKETAKRNAQCSAVASQALDARPQSGMACVIPSAVSEQSDELSMLAASGETGQSDECDGEWFACGGAQIEAVDMETRRRLLI
jgi:hypothetical protein